MQVVEYPQFRQFLQDQPRARPLDFDQYSSRAVCGCPMIHFGKEVLGITKDFSASIDNLYLSGGETLADIRGRDGEHFLRAKFGKLALDRKVTTYGDLQDCMKEEGLL